MTNLDQQQLIAILENPSETPRIECKGWLDLNDKRDKATLAKAAIALANYGGGLIVLGVGKDNAQNGKLVCLPRPSEINAYTSDDVDSAINTYADPSIDFELRLAIHPNTNVEYTFVQIPGGITQPVFAKKSYTDVIEKYACYIRKPGPKSEKPSTTQEWRDLFNRCVLANRDSMIDAFRGIIDGRIDSVLLHKDVEDLHAEFLRESRERWRELTDGFPQDDPARLGKGYFEIAFSILGLEHSLPLADITRVMQETSAEISTIWLLFDDADRRARPMGNSIETVYADPSDRPYDLHALYYWRVLDDGKFYLIRGFEEDAERHYPRFYYVIPIWRIGQALDYAATVCSLLGENLEFIFSTKYAGLGGRELFNTDKIRFFWSPRKAYHSENQDMQLKTLKLSPRLVEDNLPEIVFDLLRPLYAQFDFFELPRNVVAKEIQDMRRHSR